MSVAEYLKLRHSKLPADARRRTEILEEVAKSGSVGMAMWLNQLAREVKLPLCWATVQTEAINRLSKMAESHDVTEILERAMESLVLINAVAYHHVGLALAAMKEVK